MSKLVIVESPNKIKAIQKYLGDGYVVMASVGHVVVLPSSGEHRFGVDMETWEPNYKIDPRKKDVVAALKAETKLSDQVLIATDPDREGEAIADNLVEFLKLKEDYQRIKFNEITEAAIKAAIKVPTKVDELLVKSQKARRVLDRIIGYKLSGLMRSKISGASISPSAGRVQSIALKLVVEKERVIDAFVPTHYNTIDAVINEEVQANFFYKEKTMEKNSWILPEEVDAIVSKLSGSLTVTDVKTSNRTESKVTPFKQAVLYKRADSTLGMSSLAIQSAAQKLYENGIISYPRTDSTRMSASFVAGAQAWLKERYGEEYVATEVKGVGGAQDAHEAIRPTSLKLTPDNARAEFNLSTSEHKVYRLIYNNTCQALMLPPRKEVLRYELSDGDYTFKMSSSKVIFEGYYKVTGYEASKELPKFNKGEAVAVKKYDNQAKQTQPPARYNDGSLIEKLDNVGVGRPSTFANTIRILKDRDYVTQEGKALIPTDLGKIVIGKLVEAFPKIITEEYTSRMETELDEIAEGKFEYKTLLDGFWSQFNESLQEATTTISLTKILPIPAGKKCPKCDHELVVRRNKKNGQKFFGCSNFPICKHIESDPSQKKVWFKKNYKKK